MKIVWKLGTMGTALLLAGCPSSGGGDTGPADTGPGDTGADVAMDTGPADTGPTDTGPMDTGPADTGPADTGPMDTGPADTGPTDTGPADTGPVVPVNNCTTFMDLSGAVANRTIMFGGTSYTPNCIRIAAGQSVTFNGMFSFHPLRPGVSPALAAMGMGGTSTTPTPITNTDTGTTAMFTFANPGTYGFYCNVHYPLGMIGAIRVQ